MILLNEIFKLRDEGKSVTEIMREVGSTRSTIYDVFKRAKKYNFKYQPNTFTDLEIYHILHPKKKPRRKKPNHAKTAFKSGIPSETILQSFKDYKKETLAAGDKPITQGVFYDTYNQEAHRYKKNEYENAVVLIKRPIGYFEGNPYSVVIGRLLYSDYYAFAITRDNTPREWCHAITTIINKYGGCPEKIKIAALPKKDQDAVAQCVDYYGIELEVIKGKDSGILFSEFVKNVSNEFKEKSQQESFDIDPYQYFNDKCNEHNEESYFSKPKEIVEDEFTRKDAFAIEKLLLNPLPDENFELVEQINRKVDFNYHIEIDGMYYSVPPQFIKCSIKAVITDEDITFYDNFQKLCSHKKIYGPRGQYSTMQIHVDHENDDSYGKRIRIRSLKLIGKNGQKVVNAILDKPEFEVQGYLDVAKIIYLTNDHPKEIVEEACRKAVEANEMTADFVLSFFPEK